MRLHSSRVLKVTVNALPTTQFVSVAAQTSYSPNFNNHYENFRSGLEAKIKTDAAELALKKQRLVRHTQELTQHLLARSNSTVKVVSQAGGSTFLLFRRFKILLKHLASYPKIAYLPIMLFACGTYGFKSVEKSILPEQVIQNNNEEANPLSNFQSLKNWFLAGVNSLVQEVVGSKEVKKEGLSYLERMFKSKAVHESLITLLKGGVKDQRFLEDSKRFGINWIEKTITAEKTKGALKQLVSETFCKDQRVIQ